MTPEEILRDISHTITQGVDINKKNLFEDNIYRNSSSSSGGKDSFSTEVNPINSRVYGKSETYLGLYNSPWSRSPCNCEKSYLTQDQLPASFSDQTNFRPEDVKRKKETSGVFLIPESQGFFSRNINCYNKENSKICSCRHLKDTNGVKNFKAKVNGKESDKIGNDRNNCDLKKDYQPVDHEYSTVSEKFEFFCKIH